MPTTSGPRTAATCEWTAATKPFGHHSPQPQKGRKEDDTPPMGKVARSRKHAKFGFVLCVLKHPDQRLTRAYIPCDLFSCSVVTVVQRHATTIGEVSIPPGGLLASFHRRVAAADVGDASEPGRQVRGLAPSLGLGTAGQGHVEAHHVKRIARCTEPYLVAKKEKGNWPLDISISVKPVRQSES